MRHEAGRPGREETTVRTGERAATHLAAGEGHGYQVSGRLVTCKVTAEQTGGAYSLFEETLRPLEGTRPRIGHREDGCFYVAEGELEFLAGEEILSVGPGSLIYVPRGTLYGYANVGETSARVLNLLTPGGTHERFFEEVEQDADSVSQIAARYGIEILPPGEP